MDGTKAASLAFRIVALALSVAAAVAMGTANQLMVVSYNYKHYSALVYFVAGSAISAVCGALALFLFVYRGGGSLTVSLLDTTVQAILFSASGAALATRDCFSAGADALRDRTGTAAALGVCAAAAVSVAALTRDKHRNWSGHRSCGHGHGPGPPGRGTLDVRELKVSASVHVQYNDVGNGSMVSLVDSPAGRTSLAGYVEVHTAEFDEDDDGNSGDEYADASTNDKGDDSNVHDEGADVNADDEGNDANTAVEDNDATVHDESNTSFHHDIFDARYWDGLDPKMIDILLQKGPQKDLSIKHGLTNKISIRQHIRHAGGTIYATTTSTSTSEMAEEPIKYEDLPAEHKKKYDDLKAILEADLIGAFERTRSHGIKFKGFQPEGALEGLDLSLPSEERTRARDRKLTMPWLTLFIGILRAWEIPLYTRPPLQYTMAAPQQQGSPAYIVYKVGGDPGDYQFLYEPPKEIPHGYVCIRAGLQQLDEPGYAGRDATRKGSWDRVVLEQEEILEQMLRNRRG
ncbi:hypothetical protein QYE76_065781 [Lolium multiflorum]|uniref:Casparian strip membrane protein domain-containing protein n=1 Tax=Lolium multiflorum TaxID=4521 RepID=A0AAD8S962_LOLMU|nr:hypothetical protein QYE76_065781 [Lolium multiflorum]